MVQNVWLFCEMVIASQMCAAVTQCIYRSTRAWGVAFPHLVLGIACSCLLVNSLQKKVWLKKNGFHPECAFGNRIRAQPCYNLSTEAISNTGLQNCFSYSCSILFVCSDCCSPRSQRISIAARCRTRLWFRRQHQRRWQLGGLDLRILQGFFFRCTHVFVFLTHLCRRLSITFLRQCRRFVHSACSEDTLVCIWWNSVD